METATTTTEEEPGADLTVLIVDDDTTALEELAEIVELEGWRPLTAFRVEQAMEQLEAHPEIRVVVTDVHILEEGGERSGLDFIAAANASFADRGINFIVLSGDVETIGASIETGVADFLTKPLIPDDLVAAIREVASGSSGSAPGNLTEFLIRKMTQKSKSLQKVASDLEARDAEQRAARDAEEEKARQADDIRAGLAAGHLRPWFQPQVCIETGALRGFEALVRWIDPDDGIRSPAEFLPTAKATGMLEELDIAIQSQAFNAVRLFEDHGLPPVEIGVNLTSEQLAAPDMVETFTSIVARSGLPIARVAVEVLETAMLDEVDAEPLKKNLAALSGCGFSIQLDDFGTGHASLSSLRDVAVDRVKIDRSFIADVHCTEKLQKLTRTLIALARTLEIEVLAEGVETEEELAWLKSEGCQVVQGFLIAKPMPADAALQWALERQASHPDTN